MNKLTHKLCRKCNTPYKHYGSSLTKCPRCEELKQLKENGRNVALFSNANASQKFYGKVKGNRIKSERAGKNLRKLTSTSGLRECENVHNDSLVQKSSKGRTGINKVSAKQAKINKELSKIKAELIHKHDEICFTCGKYGTVELSHIIPRSKRPDLISEIRNCILQDRNCHEAWESLDVFKIRKFRNLKLILDYIESVDSSRFIHIMTALDKQLIASR